MRCPVCRAGVGLHATTCACGFDLVTGEVVGAMERARGDFLTASLLELVGFAAVGALVLLVGSGGLAAISHAMPLLPALVLTAVFGLGRGTWRLFDARRRFRVADRMRQPPAARVVERDRGPSAR